MAGGGPGLGGLALAHELVAAFEATAVFLIGQCRHPADNGGIVALRPQRQRLVAVTKAQRGKPGIVLRHIGLEALAVQANALGGIRVVGERTLHVAIDIRPATILGGFQAARIVLFPIGQRRRRQQGEQGQQAAQLRAAHV
ncbi:MAG: hypothetical protein IPH43_04735 [Xanthomonadales bacterium]|nr:hypothetical protein [Xanthomonadales bacterium]